nr:P-loop NTPase fold protein [uncultured Capnocytophaga sp.]
MQKIINIVKDYLTRETNNALLITGKWGVGKTYFFNNTLSEKIKEINIKGKKNSNYIPIRVSLFGVANIDDIGRKIFTELFPRLEKGMKIGKGLAKLLLSIPITKEFIPEKIPELISEFEADSETKNNIINSMTNRIVICFDDLERASKDFPIENLIGYINNLTENYDLKALIIGNTDEIESETFKKIKEKLIGVEIEFDNDIKHIFENIVKNKFHEEQSNKNKYEKFLEEKKDFICSFFNDKYKNIRTLLIVLESYKHIYSAIIGLKSGPLKEYRNDLIKSTLLFTIAIAIEFKKGNLSKKDKGKMRDEIVATLDFVAPKARINPKKLKDEYYEGSIYKFYETIFDYVIGIDTFVEEKFIEEIERKYGMSQNKNLPECYKVLNEISTDYALKISNKEYEERLVQVLKYVDKAEYKLESYANIYDNIIKYNNPLKIDEDDLKNKIIQGIEKGREKFQYNPELSKMLLYTEKSDKRKNVKEIIEFCLSINETKEQESYKKISVTLKELLMQNNFEEFKKVAIENANIPIFMYIDSTIIYDFYKNHIPLREDISKFINEREAMYAPLTVLDLEKNFYIELQQSINREATQLQSGPEYYIYNRFDKLLEKIIKAIENKKNSL